MKTFDFIDEVRRRMSHKCTGSYKVGFRDADGKVHEPTGDITVTSEDGNRYEGVTLIHIKEVK